MVAAHLSQRALDADVEPERDEPAARGYQLDHPVRALQHAAGRGVPVRREAKGDPVPAAAREHKRHPRLREPEHACRTGHERAGPRHAVNGRVRAVEDRGQPGAAALEERGFAA